MTWGVMPLGTQVPRRRMAVLPANRESQYCCHSAIWVVVQFSGTSSRASGRLPSV